MASIAKKQSGTTTATKKWVEGIPQGGRAGQLRPTGSNSARQEKGGKSRAK
jgi:hypothetical protein